MKKKLIWIGIFLILAASIAVYIVKMGGKAVEVETAEVTTGNIEEYIEETGTVMLEEETNVYAATAGRVVEAAREIGDEVKAGEVLVKLDNADITLQIKALEAQKLSVAAKFAEAKTPAEEQVSKLKALLRSAEAAHDEAKRILDNDRALYEAGAISLDSYKASVTKFAAAEASLESAQSELALAEKGLSANISKQYQAQLSEIQANIDQLIKKNKETIVYAPIDGVIMDTDIQEGAMVQAGAKLYEIGGPKGLYIESNILIEDIREIKEGSIVRIEDEDLGVKSITGTVRKIYPKAVSMTSDLGVEQKRVRIEVSLDNENEGLKPGYDMVIKIVTQGKENTLLIPDKAAFEYQGKDSVFVNEGGIAKLREIVTGLESGEQIEVLSGLKAGELVILTPNDTLEDGMKVK